ncbi:DNA utilization protein GntX [Stratiformator vulcanicus]|uniref:DNA utilization protein GntX n=2 Tax=Stratiformator vulcanicus TaxID=2527980 RepID=A0A517R505_9PLAN|nr:DNA utilization protein GntX [Stratiformator vulcanicus]
MRINGFTTPFRKAAGAVLGVLAYNRCPICRRELSRPKDASGPVCGDCASKLDITPSPCPRCAAPAGPYSADEQGCRLCARENYAFSRTVAIGVHEGLQRTALLAGQASHGEVILEWLTDRLWERRCEQLSAWNCDIVTAVPRHWTRRITTANNAAEVIGRRLARRLDRPFRPNLLSQTRWSKPQASLRPTARRKNLGDTFSITDHRVARDRTVLLCDDVMTTGTTAHRCSRALLDGGAKSVDVAVLLRGVGRLEAT